MLKLTTVVIYAFIIFREIGAARILAVFPIPAISHQQVFRPFTQELVKSGHEVVVVTTDPAFPEGQTPANLTEINVHDVSYEIWKNFTMTEMGRKENLKKQYKTGIKIKPKIFEKQILCQNVQKLVKDDQGFDLIILEASVMIAMSLFYIFKAPIILISSYGAYFRNFDTVGAPVHPLLYNHVASLKIYDHNIWEKVIELHNYLSIVNAFDLNEIEENEVIKSLFGHNVPTLSELRENVNMLYLNMHPIFEGNRPVPPSVTYVGGIHKVPAAELPEDLKHYLDSSNRGVIYMSFGTNQNPSALPMEKIKMFVSVFSQLPYDVLWKWDKDVLHNKSRNIKIAKWLPQANLLKHPNIKLFITQGGLQSTDEAISAGVPLLGIPMLVDQWFNTEKYVYFKIGMQQEIESLNEKQLKKTILTLIEDESYRCNIVKLRSLFLDQPQSPLERAVWWTEHVLRHGGARHLRAPAANMPWTEYYELDLILIVLFAFLTFVYFVYFLSKCVLLLSKINYKK